MATNPTAPPPLRLKALDFAVDTSKQFFAMSLGGIAFAVGVTAQHSDALEGILFWLSIASYGISASCGLLFLMHVVSELEEDILLDLYAGPAKMLPAVQILLMITGTALLLVFHVQTVNSKSATGAVKVSIDREGKKSEWSLPQGSSFDFSLNSKGEMTLEVK